MTSRTRCELSLFLCAGVTYAVPQDDSPGAFQIRRWSGAVGGAWLDPVVPAGTRTTVLRAHGNVLVECDLLGFRVLMPRDLIEEFSELH
jgi:hypothetical protein